MTITREYKPLIGFLFLCYNLELLLYTSAVKPENFQLDYLSKIKISTKVTELLGYA